jgi:PHD/YefM family antitoxin component YafN of YafNO toxin-antitoxin module
LSQKQSSPVVHRIPMTEARINLGQLAKRAHVNNEYFILEKDGIPVIGIMDADEMEDYLDLQDPKIREHIRKSHEEFLAGKTRPMDEFLSGRAARKKVRVKRNP